MVAGKPNRPIGAELRGTGDRLWRGLAPGTRKDAGYFWIGHPGSTRIVLCESAIDAISCFQLQTLLPGASFRSVRLHLDSRSSARRSLASSVVGAGLRDLLRL